MRKRIAPALLAGLLCLQLVGLPVMAASDTLDFYEGLMTSQGQEGSVNLDSADAIIVPADPNSGGNTVTITTAETTGATTDTTDSTGATTDTTTDSTDVDEWDETAPGTAEQTEGTTDTTVDTTETTEPEVEVVPNYTVKEVSLSSQYNSTYDLYECSASGYFYFYSNADSGDIRSDSVYLDIPYDVSYSVKKDGIAIEYANKSDITELGSYYFSLSYLNEDTETQYVTYFRFRLEEAPVTETTTTTTTTEPSTSSTTERWILGDDGTIQWEGSDQDSDEEYDVDMEEWDSAELDMDEELEFDLEPYTDELVIETDTEQTESLACTYNSEVGYYQYDLLSGSYFYASVPNGMVTNGQATVYAGSDTLVFSAYRDGVLMEDFATGVTIKDEGNYTIFITEATSQYWSAYDQVAEPILTFTITSGAASNAISIFTAPQLMTVTSIALDGEELDIISGESHYYLAENGAYTITMDSPINTQVLTLTKDTEPPIFTVDASQNNLATITYQSADVTNCTLYRDGVVVSTGVWVRTVEEAGDYTLEIVDAAGNVTVQSFTVTYGLNGASLMVIVLGVALLVGGVFVYHRISNKVNVQ